MAVVVMVLAEKRFVTTKIVLPKNWTVRFLESSEEEEIISACQGADCMLVSGNAATISDRILSNIPTIRLIQTVGVGFNHIDIKRSIQLGIPVANVPGQNAFAVAEFTIGAMIALQRHLVAADHEIKQGNYGLFRKNILNKGLREINGSKLGLIGFGDIAQKVAQIAVLLGASVSYFTPQRKSPAIENQFQVKYQSLPSLLASSDIVSIHVPLTDQTRHMIGSHELEQMPAGSLLINTARGDIVQAASLAAALESGRLGGAAIDTFQPETPGSDHPLLNLSPSGAEKLLLTPHIAGATTGAFKKMLTAACSNMERLLRGEVPEHIVNGILNRAVARDNSEKSLYKE